MDNSHFAERLSTLRKNRGLSQDDLGIKIGKGRGTIGHYERGSAQPSLDNLISICKILDVTPNELLLDKNQVTMLHENNVVYGTARVNVIIVDPDTDGAVYNGRNGNGEKQYWSILPDRTPRGDLWKVYRVKTDAMVPTANQGDWIVCSSVNSQQFREDQLYLITFQDGSRMFRQVRIVRDKRSDHYMSYELVSHNSIYRPYIVSKEEISDLHRVDYVVGIKNV